LINGALEENYPPEKEKEVAYSLSIKKMSLLEKCGNEEKKIKIGRYLSSKGFPEEAIWPVLEKLDLN
jgi:SOS response regulatory protein OraA/RecX